MSDVKRFKGPDRFRASDRPYVAQVFQHACPHCGAEAGFRCVSPKGRVLPGAHVKRFSLLYELRDARVINKMLCITESWTSNNTTE